MKRSVLWALFLVLAFSVSATLSSAQTSPEFTLGFKALADQIPDVVGTPLENEHFDLSTSNTEQRTTKGLMVWRKGDNWTAFTNGNMTWIVGQAGVQARLNTERFLWENTPVGAEARRPAPIAAPRPAPVSPGQITLALTSTDAAPPVPAPTVAAPTNGAASSTDACLACHGPFDKLVAANTSYVWPNGDKQTPHRYVPHNSKTVPDCSNCHASHRVPPSASDLAAMGKADPKWCFTCHHTGDLKCGTCHAVP